MTARSFSPQSHIVRNLLSVACLMLITTTALRAQIDATWQSGAPSFSDWSDGPNWIGGVAPTVAGDSASFFENTGAPYRVLLDGAVTIDAITYLPGADVFILVVDDGLLTLAGVGVGNNSSNAQSVTANGSLGESQIVFQNSSNASLNPLRTVNYTALYGIHQNTITFQDGSTAGNATIDIFGTLDALYSKYGRLVFSGSSTAAGSIIENLGSQMAAELGGRVDFDGTSTAGAAALTSYAGGVSDAFGGFTLFQENSTAGTASFLSHGAAFSGAYGGDVRFADSSSADRATFVNEGAAAAGAFGGVLTFVDLSSAADSVINNLGGSVASSLGGRATFGDSADAGNAQIWNWSGSAAGATGGYLAFSTASLAANAEITNVGGSAAGALGGTTEFYGDSSADNAAIANQGSTVAGASSGGRTTFYGQSVAGSATLTNYGGFLGGESIFGGESSAGSAHVVNHGHAEGGGRLRFVSQGSAGNALIENLSGGDYNGTGMTIFEGSAFYDFPAAGNATIYNRTGAFFGGRTEFREYATAGNATIISEATADLTTLSGNTVFYDLATAGDATLIAIGSPTGGNGGLITFAAGSRGGSARVILDGNGALFAANTGETLDIGSLESGVDGGGWVTILADELRVGNRNTNTTFGGMINGPGTLRKIGSGVLHLSGANVHWGGTQINGGTLRTSNSAALGTGPVSVNAGGTLQPDTDLTVVGTLTLNGGMVRMALGAPVQIFSDDLALASASSFFFSDGGFAIGSTYTLLTSVQDISLVNLGLLSYFASIPGLIGEFSVSGDGFSLLFGVLSSGGPFSGPLLQNSSPVNIPTVADFLVDGQVTTGTPTESNTVNSLAFNAGSNLQIFNNLTVTSGNFIVPVGSATIHGGAVIVPGTFNLNGLGTLIAGSNFFIGGDANVNGGNLVANGFFQVAGGLNVNSTVTVNGPFAVGGNANLNQGSLLVVNAGGAMTVGQAANITFGATAVINGTLASPQVNVNGLLSGAGLIVGNVWNNGTVAPGNSPGTLRIDGNYTQAENGTLEIEAGDLLWVGGNASLAGTLKLVAAGKLKYGQQITFLQAGSISGEFDEILLPNPSKNRGRLLVDGGTGTLLVAPTSYTLVAETTNQRNVAKALDSYIPAKNNDRESVSVALDLQSAEQYPAAFDQIAPTFYESLGNITIEQAFVQSQQLNQRLSAVRLGARGFQSIGIESPLVHDKDGKSVWESKDIKKTVEVETATNWNIWAMGNGSFAKVTNVSQVPNYRSDGGGLLFGADYAFGDTENHESKIENPKFAVGVYGGYQYSLSKYGNGGRTQINSTLFGGYATYDNGGFYVDAIVGGGYNGYDVRRPVNFSTIDRTARSQPNGGQLSASLNLGYDWEVGKFTFGPIAGVQYAYAGIAPFSETGAESLDLRVSQQNINSLRATFGGRVAYTWNVTDRIAIIPEVRMFWQHEFLNNPRNISSALDGGAGPTFGYETSAPARDSVFAGAGVSAQFGERWNAFFYYNVDFGRQDYLGNMISGGLNWRF